MPIGSYKHFKGGIYEVVGVAKQSENPAEELVIYKREKDGTLWARPASMWSEHVERDGYSGPRFTKL